MRYLLICLLLVCPFFQGSICADAIVTVAPVGTTVDPVEATIALVAPATTTVAPKVEYKTVVFNVKLACISCVNKVKENISYEKGVKGLDVSLENQTVTIVYDPNKTDEQTLAAAIAKLGYKVFEKCTQ